MDITIFQVLTWLGGAGCVIAASWILERIPKYNALAPNVKMWIFFGVASVLGIGAYSIATYVPAQVLEQLAPFFGIVAAVFSYIFLGATFHKADKQD